MTLYRVIKTLHVFYQPDLTEQERQCTCSRESWFGGQVLCEGNWKALCTLLLPLTSGWGFITDPYNPDSVLLTYWYLYLLI